MRDRLRDLESLARQLEPSAAARGGVRTPIVEYAEDFLNGVAGLDASNGFSELARAASSEAVAEMKRDEIADRTVFRENLRIHLKRIVRKELSSKPVIVTTVVEV